MIEIIRFKTNEDWLHNRANGIGASEVCAAIGLSKYQTRLEWWQNKVKNRKGDFENNENNATMAGHWLEGGVALAFEQLTGRKVIKSSAGDWVAHNTAFDFAFASPDRTYWLSDEAPHHGKNAEANKGLLECKTTNLDIASTEEDEDYIVFDNWRCPISWFLQVQYQLYCTGKKHATIAVIQLMTRKFYSKDIVYDADFVEGQLLPALAEAWNGVLNEEMPEAVNGKDALIKYPTHVEGKEIAPTPQIINSLNRIKEINEIIKPLEEEKDALTDSVKLFFEDNEAIVNYADGNKVLATFKANKDSVKFNAKRFQVEQPELYEQYCEVSKGARILRIKK